MAKYGDKRPDYVVAKIFMARMSGISKEKGGYERSGYWYDLSYYQGADTYFKLGRLKQDIKPEIHDQILKILVEDDAKNPLVGR